MISVNRITLYNYTTALVAAFPLLGLKISVLSIAFWGIFSVFIIVKEKTWKVTKQQVVNITVLSAFYLAYIISYFFAADKPEVSLFLEKNVSFLLFPLFMILNKNYIYKKTLQLSLWVYTGSTIVLALYVWVMMFAKGIATVFQEDNYYNPVLRNMFFDYTKIHLPYLGMLFAFSALILLHHILFGKSKAVIKTLCFLAMLLLLTSIVIFTARMAIVTFILAVAYFILNALKSKKQVATAMAVMVVFIGVILLLPSSQRRIHQVASVKLELPHEGQPSEEVNFRYGIYMCVKNILKDNWVTGVGVDNVQKELDACYAGYTYKGHDDYTNEVYNSHSQYFDILLKFGILGLVGFLLFLFWGIKNDAILYRAFLIIIVVGLLTENVFSRQVGVVFFAFFNTLFFISNKRGEEDNKVLP